MNESETFLESAFIEGILASPLHRLPRLVYADWLDERGDERAELLRVECEVVAALFRLAELRSALPTEWVGRVELLNQVVSVVRLPPLGDGIPGATVMCFKKKVWERVARGEYLVELETDKALVEMPSETEGVMLARLVQNGEFVPVGGPLALILRQ